MAASNRPLHDLADRTLEAVAREAERDQRIVVRPDRAVVIGHRIVAHFTARHGPDPPAGEEARAQQPVRDQFRAVRPRDAGEQHLAGIRGADAARLLRAVERERIGLQFLTPECRLEALGKTLRVGFKLVAQARHG